MIKTLKVKPERSKFVFPFLTGGLILLVSASFSIISELEFFIRRYNFLELGFLIFCLIEFFIAFHAISTNQRHIKKNFTNRIKKIKPEMENQLRQ